MVVRNHGVGTGGARVAACSPKRDPRVAREWTHSVETVKGTPCESQERTTAAGSPVWAVGLIEQRAEDAAKEQEGGDDLLR